MRRRIAILLLALAASTSACAGGWGTVSQRHAPEPGARPKAVRVVMRGKDAILMEHAIVFPDSVVEMERRDEVLVRVRSIPATDFYRVEEWESGLERSAAVLALIAAGSVYMVYAIAITWAPST